MTAAVLSSALSCLLCASLLAALFIHLVILSEAFLAGAAQQCQPGKEAPVPALALVLDPALHGGHGLWSSRSMPLCPLQLLDGWRHSLDLCKAMKTFIFQTKGER